MPAGSYGGFIQVFSKVSSLTITGKGRSAKPGGERNGERSEERRLTNYWYRGMYVFMSQGKQEYQPVEVERVQTGVRLEKRMLKVLKAIAEQKDMTLGDLLEGIVLHAFEGEAPFSPQTLKEIEQFKTLYGMTLKATDSHHLKERKR
jgi:hypothetical protein